MIGPRGFERVMGPLVAGGLGRMIGPRTLRGLGAMIGLRVAGILSSSPPLFNTGGLG